MYGNSLSNCCLSGGGYIVQVMAINAKNRQYNQFWHQLLRSIIILAIVIFQHYMEDVENLAYSIPTDSFGIGQGINMIYHTLGWSNHLQMRDPLSLTHSGGNTYENVIATVLNQNSFLISENHMDESILADILSRDSSYTKENEFQ